MLVGLASGLLLAAALAAPFYVAVPASFLPDDWYSTAAPVSVIGYLAAVAVLGLGGAAASWFHRDDSARAAAGAGLLAGLLGAGLAAAPGAGVSACGDLLNLDLGASEEADVLALLSHAALVGTWLPVAVGAALAVLGPILGALGGVTLDMYLGVSSRRAVRLVHRSSVPLWGLAALAGSMTVVSAWSGHLDLVMWKNLTGHLASGWERALLSSPAVAGAGAGAVLLGWVMRDAALLWKSKLKFFAVLWGGAALGLVALGWGGALLVDTPLLGSFVPLLFAALLLVAVVAGVANGTRPNIAFDSHPRTGWEFFGQGALVGVVCSAAVGLVAVAPISATYRVVFPGYRYLLNSGPAIPYDAGVGMVNSVFTDALYAAVLLPVAGVAYLVLAWPFWMLVRLYGRR